MRIAKWIIACLLPELLALVGIGVAFVLTLMAAFISGSYIYWLFVSLAVVFGGAGFVCGLVLIGKLPW